MLGGKLFHCHLASKWYTFRVSFTPEIDTNKCKKCNMCVESCPMQAIDRATKKRDYSKCIECMCCHELCLHKAVRLKKNNIIADVIARLSLR